MSRVITSGWFLAVIAMLLAGTTSAGPHETGRCYSADVPETLILPDGAEHEAGWLRVCMTRKLSPVQGLHTTYIDGRPIGAFNSRLGTNEDGSETEKPFFLFRRTFDGKLALLGYAVRQEGTMRTYRMRVEKVRSYPWHFALSTDETAAADQGRVTLAADTR